MFNIAICDDEVKCVEALRIIVLKFFADKEISIKTEEFYDGDELLRSKKRFDLIFMDIEMDRSNGIDVGMKLRNDKNLAPIVYITSYSDYSRRAFRVHAFDFIQKPIKRETIEKTLEDAVEYYNLKKENKKIELKTDIGVEVQPLDSVMYFLLLDKRKIQVTATDRMYMVRESLSEIFQKINNKHFFYTNRSCIVNLKYVKSISKNNGIIMINGEWLPLADKRRKNFLLGLSDALRE